MKISNMALLFVVIILPFVVKNFVTGEVLEQKAFNKIWLDRMVDTAVDDAIDDLVVRGSGNTLIIDKEAAFSSFIETLYLNMGALGNDTKEAIVNLYVPVFVVMDYDGFYMCRLMSYIGADGRDATKHIWSDKIPYVWESSGVIYAFHMDDQLAMISQADGEYDIGHWELFCETVPDFPFHDEGMFYWRRADTITSLVENHLKTAVSEHNKIAFRYGYTYDFNLPIVEDDTWRQCIGDIGILTFVQGVPMGFGGEYYNRYALGGASIYKGEPYFVQEAATGWLIYHDNGCPHITEDSIPVISDYEAAKMGAFPCEDCKP